MKFCDDCKWAGWQRTSNGRLHPSKQGRCTKEWTPPPLPAAFYFTQFAGNTPVPSGGYIERGNELREHCAYWALK